MSAIALEIFFVLLLIMLNGLFSGAEMAVVSSRKVRLEQMANQGIKKARAALKLANSPNNFLSTVQIGITLIGILSGAVGGATLVQRLQPLVDNFEFLKPYSEGISVTIVVTLIAYLSLVFGELLPKRVALNSPEKIACSVAGPMNTLSKFTAPLVHILSFSTEILLNLFGIQASSEPSVTEEEIKVLIQQGTQLGMFEESEQRMVERVFSLSDRPIKALMTPRFEIIWLDIQLSPEENQRRITESNYSRFPVCRENLNECLGILRGSNFLSARLAGQEIDLETMLQNPLYVPENTSALKILEQFKKTGIHIALITDEYGDIEGMVTLNDLVEAIVGNIDSSENREEPMIIEREDGSWLLDGLLSIDDVKHLLKIKSLPEEETGNYHTLGGFMVNFLGYIPTSAEYFDCEGMRFEIIDMDSTRVDKVLVKPLPANEIKSQNTD